MPDNRNPPFNLKLDVIREPSFVPMTPRRREVCWDFGVPPREEPYTVANALRIQLRPGTIVLLNGPSGSGKSSVLAAIAERVGQVTRVGQGRFPTDRAIVDAVAPRQSLATALEILTACGLGEPRLWLRRYGDLSDGERFRAALARAIGASLARKTSRPIICDEFTSILHSRAAKAIAYNLRKLVTRAALMLVVATTREDIIEDLQPDQTVRLGALETKVICRPPRIKPMSLRRRAVVEPGCVRDYRMFGPMHYRHRDGLGFVDKVFLLKEGPGGDPLGILVFAHAPMELALRNRSTAGRFVRNVRRLNRELRILRRLVMHPDIRGCGLGHWFVRQTLPRVGVRFIESLAAMGAVNPVFEKAGMHRIGRCPLPRGRMALLERMRAWGVDPFADDFPRRIARYGRVRRMVEQTIQDWVTATQGAARFRIAGKSPTDLAGAFRQIIGQPPLYYLWDREGEYPIRDDRSRDDSKSNPGLRVTRETADECETRRTTGTSARRSPDRPSPRRSQGSGRATGIRRRPR